MDYWQHSFTARDGFTERSQQHRRSAPQRAPARGVQPCARGEWCASGSRTSGDDGTPARAPADARGVYCAADEAIIRGCLADPDGADDLTALHARLAVAALSGQRGEVLIHLPFGPSVLLRVDLDELMRYMTDAILHWHERVAGAFGLADIAAVSGLAASGDEDPVRRRELGTRAGKLTAAASPILAAHIGGLLSLPMEPAGRTVSPLLSVIHPDAIISARLGRDRLVVALDGAAAGREIMRLQYAARAVLGETELPAVGLLGVPCRRCTDPEARAPGPLTLTAAPPPQHDGDPVYKSQCSRCGHLMTAGEYKEWVALNAAWLRSRLTPAQIASLAPDLRALVRPAA